MFDKFIDFVLRIPNNPGTVDGYCEHGTYVGGCGIDWMCHMCEMGVEWRDYIIGMRKDARWARKRHNAKTMMEGFTKFYTGHKRFIPKPLFTWVFWLLADRLAYHEPYRYGWHYHNNPMKLVNWWSNKLYHIKYNVLKMKVS
jgi:hypothetical protein